MKENWKYKKIKDICEKESSSIVLNKIEENNGDYALYGASGYVKGIDFYHNDKPYIGIVKDGSGVGRVNIYPAFSSLVGTMQYIYEKDGFDLAFIKYALQSLNLAKFVTGAAIPHIYFKDYSELPIPVPPLPLQQQIVAELDLLSDIIEKQKRQLTELDKLAQATFYDMFGDPNINYKKWNTLKFKDAFKLKSGDGLVAKDFIDGEYPVYGGNGICGYHNEYNKNAKTIIIGRVGVYCGNARLVKDKFWLTDNAFETSFNDDLFVYEWLPYLLNIINLHQYANHAAQPVISNVGLKDINIILPPLSLQQSFVSKIEVIEKQKELINNSIKESQRLFDSRMEYWFG